MLKDILRREGEDEIKMFIFLILNITDKFVLILHSTNVFGDDSLLVS